MLNETYGARAKAKWKMKQITFDTHFNPHTPEKTDKYSTIEYLNWFEFIFFAFSFINIDCV